MTTTTTTSTTNDIATIDTTMIETLHNNNNTVDTKINIDNINNNNNDVDNVAGVNDGDYAKETNDDKKKQIKITRNPLSLAQLEKAHPKQAEGMYRSPRMIMQRLLPEQISVKSFFYGVFPILKWLPNYNIKQDLTMDMVAGVTVLALQIPQGLAYSKLVGVDPIYGLYSTFFSMVIYSVMATSRHMSMGLYAITCMMSRNVVLNYHHDDLNNPPPTPIEILVTLCFITGVIQFTFGAARLGNCSLMFSDNFLSGFTFGCAILITNSQLTPTLGINFSPDENDHLGIPSDCINTWISIIKHLGDTNLATLLLSTCVLVLLINTKYVLEPYLKIKYKFNYTIPIDLISIIITTILSKIIDLNGNFDVDIVGDVPNNFATPTPPRGDLIPNLLMDGVIMAIVSSVCQVSMAKMLAEKYNYEISLNQEFVAYGVTNTICSFNHCFPTCASLARTNVNENAGARTQLSTLLCSALLLVCLFFLTTFLGPLPKATLSCIIIVAMVPTYEKLNDLFKMWSISRFDAFHWIVTCFTVTIFGVNIGIYCGLTCSIVIILIRAAIPTSTIMLPVPESELYLSPTVYGNLNEDTLKQNKIAIFCFQGPLTFLSAAIFRTDIRKKILEPLKEERNRTKEEEEDDMNSNTLDRVVTIDGNSSTNGCSTLKKKAKPNCDAKLEDVRGGSGNVGSSLTQKQNVFKAQSIRTLILDMSQIIYLDYTGIKMIIELNDQLKRYEVNLLLACCSISALSTLERACFFTKIITKDYCFISVHDAVIFASQMSMLSTMRENGSLPIRNDGDGEAGDGGDACDDGGGNDAGDETVMNNEEMNK